MAASATAAAAVGVPQAPGDEEALRLPWKDVEEVLEPQAAEQLLQETRSELSDPAFVAAAARAMAGGKAVRHDAKCLLLLGPSGAGKSRAISEGQLLRVPEGALVLDGDVIRNVSKTWAGATDKARSLGLAGFGNYFGNYFQSPMNTVKRQVLDEALQSKANLIIPDTASNFKSSVDQVSKVLAAGYTVTLGAIYADRAACEFRGQRRSGGKKYSSKNWEASVQAIVDMLAHFQRLGVVPPASTDGNCEGGHPQIFNSTGLLHRMPPSRLHALLEEHRRRHSGPRAAEGATPAARWCEASLLAGVYRGEREDWHFEVVPSDSGDEVVPVTLTAVRAGHFHGALQCTFEVASCTLRAPGGSGGANDAAAAWRLRLGPGGRACLEPLWGAGAVGEAVEELLGGGVNGSSGGACGSLLRQQAPVQGHSLSLPVDQDPDLVAALDGLDFCGSPLRELTEAELQGAATAARARGPSEAPRRTEPRALVVVAPSGAGKSTVEGMLADCCGMRLQQAVSLDSRSFQEAHAQLRALYRNGERNGGIWYRAWPAAKAALTRAKDKVRHEAVQGKKDVVVSDTGADLPRLLKLIGGLKAQGYLVHLGGVFAEPWEILARGVAREVVSGKRYNRDLPKLSASFDAFGPAVEQINGRFCLVRNRQGRPPEVYRAGPGGQRLAFDLQEALAWSSASQESPTEVRLAPEDVRFLAEGNANVVLSYLGSQVGLEGCVLRCRKGENAFIREDAAFVAAVAARMFGADCVDAGELVSLAASEVAAVDEAILGERPAKRRCKRLDSSVQDPCGRVLALKVSNLVSPPPHCSKVLGVEIKPKCALLERPGLPCRYQLLQHWKRRAGKVKEISAYDPVKLLSKQLALVREALESVLATPQNNLRVFVGGRLVFSEDAGSGDCLGEELRSVGLQDQESLLSLISGVFADANFDLPERLKRVQAWAAGETAHLVNQLYGALQAQLGSRADDVLARPEHFRSALEGLEDSPCDESGINLAAQQMDELLEKVNTRSWSGELEQEVVRWCCRFLLGRLASDVSIFVNFVFDPPTSSNPGLEATLTGLRFKRLSSRCVARGASGEAAVWFRVTVVDADRKAAAKIPEYASQLDEYAQAYYTRFSSASAASSSTAQASAPRREEAVGGHAGSIIFEGDTVWKRDQGGARGTRELNFYRWALDRGECASFVPRLAGYRTAGSERWLGISNLLDGLGEPAVLDVKMGTRTWGTDATPDKISSQSAKASTRTTGSLGVFVVGGKLPCEGQSGFRRVGEGYGQPVRNEAELVDLLKAFLRTPALRTSALEGLRRIGAWWSEQHEFAFYASSILMVYDARHSGAECRVAMIDFAHAEAIAEKAQDLSGYSVGLATLERVISGVPSLPGGAA